MREWLKGLRVNAATLVAGYILVNALHAAVKQLPSQEAWLMLTGLVAGAGGWLYLERRSKEKPPAS